MASERNGPKRARDFGIPSDLHPIANNSIMDVDEVLVGHSQAGDDLTKPGVHTGVTAILPAGNRTKGKKAQGIDTFVPAGWFALNGNGEMTGTTWIEESGFLEGPIMLTDTLSVGTVRNGVITYGINQLVAKEGNQFSPDDFSLNLPVVGETSA